MTIIGQVIGTTEAGEKRARKRNITPIRGLFLGIAILGGIVFLLLIVSGTGECQMDLQAPYVGNKEIHLQWGVGRGPCEEFRYYEIHENGGKIATINEWGTREYKMDFLTKDRLYRYRVMMFGWDGSEIVKCDNSTESRVVTGEVGGVMLFGTEWTEAKGPYLLVKNVRGNGQAFQIGAGTEIHSNGTKISGGPAVLEDLLFFGGGLEVSDHPSVTIRNCHFDINSSAPAFLYVIEIINCTESTITGNTFENLIPNPPVRPTATGIRFHVQEGYACGNALIEDNDFSDMYSGIIGGFTEDCHVQNNTFIDNLNALNLAVGGPDLTILRDNNVSRIDMQLSEQPHGVMMIGTSILMYHNTFEDIFEAGGISGNDSTIRDNTIINCTNGFDVDGTDMIIEENFFDGNGFRGHGLLLEGSRITVWDNEFVNIGNHDYGAVRATYSLKDSRIDRNEIWSGDIGIGIIGPFPSDNITIKDNHIHNTTEYGIYLEHCTNFTIENNTIEEITQDVEPFGILLRQGNTGNTIRKNTIRNTGKAGISFGGITHYHIIGNDLNTIEDNNISGAEFGILVDGYWNDFSLRYFSADNGTIARNTITDVDTGIFLKSSSNNMITDNTILNSESRGIETTYYYWSAQEIAYRSSNNMIARNRITTSGYGWEIQEIARDITSTNEYVENTIGTNFPTKVSVSGFDSSLHLGGVETHPVRPMPPENPTIGLNISNYLDIRYEGQPLDITFHYEDGQLRGLSEDRLRMWRLTTHWGDYREGEWTTDQDMKIWNTGWNLDDLDNTLSAKVANLTDDAITVFAPLIEAIVYNKDTDRHFTTIQAAIDDIDTFYGHTIYVGPYYNETPTFENIIVYKGITLLSTTGNPVENHIRAGDVNTDVIKIDVNEVTIKGFTIRGSTTARGINAGTDTHDILIENCILKENFNGLLYKQIPTRAGFNPIIIERCAFHGNSNAGILVDGTLNVLIRDTQFSGGLYGIAVQNSHNARIDNCSVEETAESGIYILSSTKTTVIDSLATGCLNGIHVSDSEDSEISWSGTVDCETGILLVNAHENKLHNLTVEKLRMFGIHLQGSDMNEFRDVTINESSGTVIIGMEFRNSDENIIDMVKVRDITTVGYSATGIRILSGSTRNMVKYTMVSNITSSNSTGIVVGSSDNEFVPVTIRDIGSFGKGQCAGIHVLPNANSNFFSFIDIMDITANITAFGVYLESNGHNNFSDCNVGPVGSQTDIGVGFGYVGCPSGKVISSEIGDTDIGFLCEAGSTPEFHWNTIEDNVDFGVKNTDSTVIVDAVNNYWGDDSGPGGVGPGSGDAVSEYVNYDPWTGEPTQGKHEETVQAGTGTVDSKATSDTEVLYDTTSTVTITTQMYASNPGSTFTGDFGKYMDVHLDTATGVNSLEIRLYYTADELGTEDESKLKMYWWDGQSWLVCSDSGVNTDDTGEYSGFIWAKVRSETSPSLSDMSGTPFSGGTDPGEEEDDDDRSLAGIMFFIIMLVLLAVIIIMFLSGMKGIPLPDSGAAEMKTITDGSATEPGDNEEPDTEPEKGNEEGISEDGTLEDGTLGNGTLGNGTLGNVNNTEKMENEEPEEKEKDADQDVTVKGEGSEEKGLSIETESTDRVDDLKEINE